MKLDIKIRNIVSKFIKLFFTQYLRVKLLSNRDYELTIMQRDKAVKLLSHDLNKKLYIGCTIVIFSMDRAHQLFNLLYTYRRACRNNANINIIVLMKYSSDLHKKSYDLLINKNISKELNIQYIHEKNSFDVSLAKILNLITTKNIIFLVDDDIFIRECDATIWEDIDTLTSIFSLRHSPSLKYSYTTSKKQEPPNFKPYKNNPNYLKFNWFEKLNEWSNPWSLDGHVLSTAEVVTIAGVSQFKGPNTFESILSTFNSLCHDRTGVCNEKSIILNLPLNRVQNEVDNNSGEVNQEYLAEVWLKGFILDVMKLWNWLPSSPHELHSFDLIQCPD